MHPRFHLVALRAEWLASAFMKISLRLASLVVCSFLVNPADLFANGGAWPTGVPLTGNAAPSDKARTTEVAIEDESLTLNLHQEFAEVEVRYRMRNTGPKVVQDFFFPIERWQDGGDSDLEEGKAPNLQGYSIKADNAEVKFKTIDVAGPKKPEAETTPEPEEAATPEPADSATPGPEGETTETVDEEPENTWAYEPLEFPSDLPPPTKHWNKSEIPFAANQTREIVIRYRTPYSGYERGVSDDSHVTDRRLVYSLSPAATWKGTIAHGKVTVNVLHPRFDQVRIERPADRFKKASDVKYEWEFRDLEPTLADDIRIVARSGYKSYNARSYAEPEREGEENQPWRSYVIEGDRYFLNHADYEPSASSTLAPAGKINYEVVNLRNDDGEHTWAEGAAGDGIGESITLNVRRPLPLDSIEIMPGYRHMSNASLWTKNNRVAELEVTLNGEHTFTAKIPDEKFEENYPVVVRGYDAPVKTIKMTIKAVHRGSAARDTCISTVRLRGKIAERPKVQPSR